MEARSGRTAQSMLERLSISPWRTAMKESEPVKILLVEDNPNDVELTLHALRASNLANDIKVVRDGAEALDFIMCRGPFADRDRSNGPTASLLDQTVPQRD